ncbi:hypothetical protein OIO90_000632 [Microbotryomycetes sp. JL221]|nr:hypothetical protein OIO90_000632 [Microbotryomycetes sp. JL221]
MSKVVTSSTGVTTTSMAPSPHLKFARDAYPFPWVLSRSATPELSTATVSQVETRRSLIMSHWSDSSSSSSAASDSYPVSPNDATAAGSMKSSGRFDAARPESSVTARMALSLERKLQGINHDLSKLTTSDSRAATGQSVPPTPDDEQQSRLLNAGGTPGAMPPLPMLPIRHASHDSQASSTSSSNASTTTIATPEIALSPPPPPRNLRSAGPNPLRASKLGFGMTGMST